MSQETLSALEGGSILTYVRWTFHDIHTDESLTEADKKQLKDFYLQHMIAPTARKLLERYSPNEFKNTNPRSASPDRNTPDR